MEATQTQNTSTSSTNDTLDQASALYSDFRKLTDQTTTVTLLTNSSRPAMVFSFQEPAVLLMTLFFAGSIVALMLLRRSLRTTSSTSSKTQTPVKPRTTEPAKVQHEELMNTALVKPVKLVKINVRKIRKNPHYET